VVDDPGLFVFYAEYDVIDSPNTAWKRLEAAFAVLHRTPALKTLELLYAPYYREYFKREPDGEVKIAERLYSHQWDIIAAIGSSRYPLPRIQSLTIHKWTADPEFDTLYYKARIAELTGSLRHLRFSLPRDSTDIESSLKQRTEFWDQVIVPRILQPAVNLESLEISQETLGQPLDFSKVDTYPRLATLSLRFICWERGAIRQGKIIKRFPVEDFIMRHRMTLKKLELYHCTIMVKKSRRTPSRSWADVYNQLAEVLTGLVELVVVFGNSGYRDKSYGGDVYRPRSDSLSLEWSERDAQALKHRHFKAVVENRVITGGCLIKNVDRVRGDDANDGSGG
jgi:hypothetical protein